MTSALPQSAVFDATGADYAAVLSPLSTAEPFLAKPVLQTVLAVNPDNLSALKMQPASIPVVPGDGLLLRTLGCGVCGSDLDKLIHQRSQPGQVLGHEVVGEVIALGKHYQGPFAIGERVVTAHHVPCQTCHYCQNNSPSMCRTFKTTNLIPGGFAQYIAVSGAHIHHVAFSVPHNVSNAVASCVEPLACVLRAVERGEKLQDAAPVKSSVLIIGLGFIGAMAAQVYAGKGYSVFGVDRLPERVALCESILPTLHGYVTPVGTDELTRQMVKSLPVERVDTVFLTAVTPQTIDLAMRTVRDGGTLVVFASAMNPSSTEALSGTGLLDPSTLYFREIQVVPSYSPSLESLEQAAAMIFESNITLEPLITHTVSPEQLPDAIDWYREGKASKVYVEFAPAHPPSAGTPATPFVEQED